MTIGLKNGTLIVKLEDDVGVDDQDIAKGINQMPCHLGSYLLGYSKRLLNNVIRVIDGFNSNNVTTEKRVVHNIKKTLANKGFVAKSPGLGKNK